MHALIIILAFGLVGFGIFIPFVWGWHVDEYLFGAVFVGCGLMFGFAGIGWHPLFYCLLAFGAIGACLAIRTALRQKPPCEVLPPAVNNN